jgi:glutathione S-transferase
VPESTRYELYYWPSIQGRGEFIRLAFEAAGASYVDVARLSESEGGGVPAMMKFMRGEAPGIHPLAPPFIKVGDLVISQTPNILAFIAPRLGLVPDGEASRVHANQLMLTIADLANEAHDTHHPIGVSLYYEDQKPEALRRAQEFVKHRIPKFLGYFERILERGDRKHLIGSALSYVDLGMFQLLAGLEYAFPRASERFAPQIPLLQELQQRVANAPNVRAYLASPRRIPFNEHGLFRRYPELDVIDG